MVDASGFRAAARPDRQRGCTRLSQNMLRYDDPFRKNKNFDFCATFLRLRTPFRPLRGGNGPLCVRFAAFSGFNPRFDAPRQFAIAKKLQFRAYFCFWAPGSAPCWCRGRGVSRAQRLCGRFWAALWAGQACGDVPGVRRGACSWRCDAGGGKAWMT